VALQRFNPMMPHAAHRLKASPAAKPPLPACVPHDPLPLAQIALGNHALQRLLRSRVIQAKLAINAPGDEYEQEADRMAEQVAHLPAPGDAERWGIPKQFPSSSTQHSAAGGETGRQLQLKGGGQPLPTSVRAFFEPRFGCDFGQVRVHTDARAAVSARTVDALAYTFGRDIVFGAGQYAPETASGRKLLAHELAHVVQQRAVGPSYRTIQSAPKMVQRAEPASTITIGAVVAKCIIGAITGALFDAAIQAALHAWERRSWRFWEGLRLNYCSIILSAILGCIAAPISAAILEPWIAAQLGTRLGGIAGTLIGRILLFIAQKLGMAIPKALVGKLLKLGCISPEQSAALGVDPATVT
jgi:hypothetical protein